MKQRIQGIIIGVLATLMLCGGIAAAASETIWKDIRVAYGSYQIVINGEKYEAKDKSGIIEPFSYNGWIYAPFEHIAKALGQEVRWDGKTNTMHITTPAVPPPPKPKATYFFDVLNAYEIKGDNLYFGNALYTENTSFKILGDEYANGCTYKSDRHDNSTKRNITASYNLRGQYNIIKGVLGHIDGTGDCAGTFSVYLDAELYKEYPLTENMLATDVVIDVTGVQIMQIKFSFEDRNRNNTTYGFGNVTIE